MSDYIVWSLFSVWMSYFMNNYKAMGCAAGGLVFSVYFYYAARTYKEKADYSDHMWKNDRLAPF